MRRRRGVRFAVRATVHVDQPSGGVYASSYERGREVLRPGTGRAVFLCGNWSTVVGAAASVNRDYRRRENENNDDDDEADNDVFTLPP